MGFGFSLRRKRREIKFIVKMENLKMLDEALKTECEEICFGSEFCEWKLPSLNLLKRVYKKIKESGKKSIYVTPRVTDQNVKKLKEHLDFLNTKEAASIIVNDLGILSLSSNYPNLKPYLGRQLVYIPSRCPWGKISDEPMGFFEKRQVKRIFYQTSLNFEPTIQFFKSYGVEGVEVDWIPECFPSYKLLVENGLNVFIDLQLLPVTITRRCHTARFFGEEKPEKCSRPCLKHTFLIKHKILKVNFFLQGNVVFKLTEFNQRDVKLLIDNKPEHYRFVINMNEISKTTNKEEVKKIIKQIRAD